MESEITPCSAPLGPQLVREVFHTEGEIELRFSRTQLSAGKECTVRCPESGALFYCKRKRWSLLKSTIIQDIDHNTVMTLRKGIARGYSLVICKTGQQHKRVEIKCRGLPDLIKFDNAGDGSETTLEAKKSDEDNIFIWRGGMPKAVVAKPTPENGEEYRMLIGKGMDMTLVIAYCIAIHNSCRNSKSFLSRVSSFVMDVLDKQKALLPYAGGT